MMKLKIFGSVLSLVILVNCQSPGPATVETSSSDKNSTSVAMKEDAYSGLSILQGVSSSTMVRINIQRQKSESFDYEISSKSDGILASSKIKKTIWDFAGSDVVMDELEITALKPGIDYTFRAVDLMKKTRDERQFRTLDEKTGPQFAVVSCSDDSFVVEQKQSWISLWAKKPDFILMIGDNVYTDWSKNKKTGPTTPESLWARYSETRAALELYRQKNLIPVFALWDDHDFGVNDGDRRYAFKNQANKIFHSFFPQGAEAAGFKRGPGVSSSLTFGGQAFLLLDDRSFRSPDQRSPICLKKPESVFCKEKKESLPDLDAKIDAETHFGKELERWSFNEVRRLHRPTWLISGDQWFGAYSPFESYEGNHPTSFKKYIREMSKSAYRAAFISGDRHSSEITRISKSVMGYETYEVVSSPIHAKVFPSNWDEFPNPNQISGTANAMNFTMIKSNFDKKIWSLQVQNYKIDGSLSFEKSFSIQ
jgi:alkaline phosphatase D